MQPSTTENFREDGEIFHSVTGQKILYDFEKRNSYYDAYGKFKFSTFGQFERKIQKPEIALSIQCSKNQDGFIIAWHADYQKEKIVYLHSKTASGTENTGKRFTKDFIEIRYSEMSLFYKMLAKAFTTKNFNASCFTEKK